MASIVIDLTTLSNYDELPDGIYVIKCVAKGENIYTPSNLSEGVEYQKVSITVEE